jgi:hypothetical protein
MGKEMTELETLRSRVAELEEALKPFAEFADAETTFKRNWGYADAPMLQVACGGKIYIVDWTDFHRAASLISDPPEAEPRHSDTAEQRAAFDELLRADGELYDDAKPDVVERACNPLLAFAQTFIDLEDEAEDLLTETYRKGRYVEDTILEVLKKHYIDPDQIVFEMANKARAAIAAMPPAIDAEKVAEIAARHWLADQYTSLALDAGQAAHADRAALLEMTGGLKDE